MLREPAFAALFGPDSRAEVAIAAEVPQPDGKGPALRLTGKIDRLVRDGDSVLIVDYKTNRPPPDAPERVAEAYLLQLAAYRLWRRPHISRHGVSGPRFSGPTGRASWKFRSDCSTPINSRLWQLDPASLDA